MKAAGLIGIAVDPSATGDPRIAIVEPGRQSRIVTMDEVAAIEASSSPRWVWWSKTTARALVESGIRPARCWDLGAVHRLLHGGWQSGTDRVWARAHDLDVAAIPTCVPVDLFNHAIDAGDLDDPVGGDGYLRPEWVAGAWADDDIRLGRWAALTLDLQVLQAGQIDAVSDVIALAETARSESAAELLCAELEVRGLPFDRETGERIIASFVGPRPATAQQAAAELARRDDEVLQHLPPGTTFDLRSPDQVKSLLRRVGIEVPDTRAWRLEALRAAHPIIEPLLTWRRAERVLTTFGYNWVDDNVGADGRLRGSWSGSDGAAGRMTATAGLHNMPAELRPAIRAEAGRVFVRADLGQIEPRILAAVSGDARLAAATQADDMYAPVADQLRVERDIAKVAVLGAMYGQTTGKGAEALRGLEREYPVAMAFLATADRSAQGGNDLRTHGGRLVTMSATSVAGTDGTAGTVGIDDVDGRTARSRAAARGRYGRNAMVQGAAAEFFKTWAVLARARLQHLDAHIVLCLHDELLIDVPEDSGEVAATLLDQCLQEAAHRWSPLDAQGRRPVRFLSDTSIIGDWSQAK